MQFKNIIEQRELIQKLTASALNERIPHAQLFLGPQGNQKLALAIAYGQFLNCKQKQIFSEINEDGLLADSCGTCSSCIKFQNLAHPDLHFFFPNNRRKSDPSTKKTDSSDYMNNWREMVLRHHAEFSINQWYDEIGLDTLQGYINVRDVDNIIKTLTYKNFEAPVKIIIIWMAENFYNDGATRLLKVLEEPSEGTVFLLISENSSQIPATILSRTQLIRVPKAKNIVARTDDDNFNHTNFVTWMRICLKVDTPKMDEFSRQMRDLGRERLKLFLNHALEKIRWTVMVNYHNADQLLVAPEEQEFLTKFSPYIHANNLTKFVTELEKAIYHIERNANGHLLMFDLSIKLSGLLKKTA